MRPTLHAVAGIIKNQEKFLIAKRPPRVVMPGYWEFPGGKVEAEETQEAALARELEEELGIQVQRASFLKLFPCEYSDYLVLLHVWQVLEYTGIPHGKETQDIRWITADEFSQFEFLPSNEALLHFLQHSQKC